MFLLWNLDKVEHLDAEHLHILDFQIRGLVVIFCLEIYSSDQLESVCFNQNISV